MTKKIKDMTPKELQQYYEKKTTQAYNKAAKRMIKVLNSKLDENTDWYSLKPSEFEHHMAKVWNKYNISNTNTNNQAEQQVVQNTTQVNAKQLVTKSGDGYDIHLTDDQMNQLNNLVELVFSQETVPNTKSEFGQLTPFEIKAYYSLLEMVASSYKQDYPDESPVDRLKDLENS